MIFFHVITLNKITKTIENIIEPNVTYFKYEKKMGIPLPPSKF